MEIMGMASGEPLAIDPKASRTKLFQQAHQAERTVSFIDLCGHEKYLRTTVFGLTGLAPDYTFVLVGSNMGLSRMHKEHLGISVSLRIPPVIIVTKIDLAPPDVDKNTMEQIAKVLKLAKRLPYVVKSMDNVHTAASTILADKVTPVFRVSNVTGEGLDFLRKFLALVPPRTAAALAAPAVLGGAGAGAGAGAAAGGKADAAGEGEAGSPRGGDAGGSAAAADGDGGEGAAPGSAARRGADALALPAAPSASSSPAGGGGDDDPTTSAASAAGKAAPLHLNPSPTLAVAAVPVDPSAPGECIIDSVYNVPGVGTVVAGIVSKGCLRVGQTALLGPDRTGDFLPVVVRSIQIHYTPVELAWPGTSAAFAIRPKGGKAAKGLAIGGGAGGDKKRIARKGMALSSPELCPNSFWEFKAEVLVLHHQTTLTVGYAPIIHVGCVVQSATLTDIRGMDGLAMPALRTGDRAVITARFLYRPEYLRAGADLLFREGRAKGIGKLLSVSCPHHVGGAPLGE
jgi:GTPase